MPGRLEFDVSWGPQSQAQPSPTPSPDSPFRILVLADLSNGQAGSISETSTRKLDFDNFESTLARLAPRLSLHFHETEQHEIRFLALDDFHPDRLLESFAPLARVRRGAAQLEARWHELAKTERDPSRIVARLVGELIVPPESATAATTGAPPQPDADADTGTDTSDFERLLGGAARPAPKTSPPSAVEQQVSRLLESALEEHLRPSAAPLDAMTADLDAVSTALLRTLLANPDFRRLEATWASLRDLIGELESVQQVEIHVFDVTANAILGDVAEASGTGQRSALVERLTSAPHYERGHWSVVIADYEFEPKTHDLLLLAALGRIAEHLGAPVIGQARPTSQPLEPSIASQWQGVRTNPLASWIGLVHPRVLVRRPYGKRSEPIVAFPFEEFPATFANAIERHHRYLWGNGAYVCARLLGLAFGDKGWAMEPDDCLELGGLPIHWYDEGGESHLRACAELTLNERTANEIQEAGYMALSGSRSSDAVRLVRFQSIADPVTALNGPWSS